MKFTVFSVEVPADLIAEAEAAAKRINDREHETNRTERPLVVDERQVLLIVLDFLINTIVADAQQSETASANAAIRQKLATLQAHKSPLPSPPRTTPPA